MESRGAADFVDTRVESELSEAKKTVRDLASKIEESNSSGKLLQKRRKPKRLEGEPEMAGNGHKQYVHVMKELERIKQVVNKLKLDMTIVVEEKIRAEKTIEALRLRKQSRSSSVETISKEIQEVNDEQVLVELARMEAVKEYEAIEAQRKEEAQRYALQVEEIKRKVNEIIQENNLAKELEMKLAVTVSDVNMLESELAVVKEIDRMAERTASMKRTDARLSTKEEYPPSLRSVMDELEAAKRELACVKQEGFTIMASMDVIRGELNRVKEQKAQMEKAEEKQDVVVQNLNTKLMRGQSKLKAVLTAEEKANLIASNLSATLDQIRTEARVAMKEKELLRQETETMKSEIAETQSQIELAEEALEAAMRELEEVKLSEEKSLNNLKLIVENTIKVRDSASRHSSTIKISKFEYEYLIGRAERANEIADKKVAAAQAWVQALKANEKEILIKAETAQREVKELPAKEEVVNYARKSAEGELQKWRPNEERKFESEDIPIECVFPRKSVRKSGNLTPGKRPRVWKLGSPGGRHLSRTSTSKIKVGNR